MVDLNAGLCALPVDLRAIVLSHIEHVKTRQILALSSTFREAFSRPGALPRTFDFEGVAGDDIADHLVRLLDDDRVRSLEKERALELIGVHKDRLCEYACVQRNFEVLKWARNELDLPWAPYPPGHVSDDVLVLRVLRDTGPTLTVEALPGGVVAGGCATRGVARVDDGSRPSGEARVEQRWPDRSGAGCDWAPECAAAFKPLLQSADELAGGDRAAHVAGELYLNDNQLTSLPAEIWQLTSLRVLDLGGNQLTSVPAEIGQLTSLRSCTSTTIS